MKKSATPRKKSSRKTIKRGPPYDQYVNLYFENGQIPLGFMAGYNAVNNGLQTFADDFLFCKWHDRQQTVFNYTMGAYNNPVKTKVYVDFNSINTIQLDKPAFLPVPPHPVPIAGNVFLRILISSPLETNAVTRSQWGNGSNVIGFETTNNDFLNKFLTDYNKVLKSGTKPDSMYYHFSTTDLTIQNTLYIDLFKIVAVIINYV